MATPIQRFSVTVRSLLVFTNHRKLSLLMVNCPETKDVHVEMKRNLGVNPMVVKSLVEEIERRPNHVRDIISEMTESLFATQNIRVNISDAQGYVETFHEDEVASELKGAFQFNATVTFL